MNEYAKMLEMMEAGHASVLCREWTGSVQETGLPLRKGQPRLTFSQVQMPV